MAVACNVTIEFKADETLADAYVSTSKPVRHSGLDVIASKLSAATAVPVTKVASGAKALSGGAATLDLTAVAGVAGVAVDGTGLKVQLVHLRAKATNAGDLTLSEGASNGYELLGNGWTVKLKAGQTLTLQGIDKAPDIGSGAKNIDLSGTGTDQLEYVVVMG